MSTLSISTETVTEASLTVSSARSSILTDRLGMASGLAFVLLWLYSATIVPEPPYEFDNQILADFYKQNVASYLVGAHLVAISFLLFLIFIGTLHSLVRRLDQARSWLPSVLLGAGLMTATMFMVSQASLVATALMASRDVSPDLVRGLDEISHSTAHLFVAPLALFLITTGICILRFGIMPKWISFPCLLPGITLLITTGSFNHKEVLHKIGALALLLFMLSILIMSIALLWRSRKTNGSEV
ncbi:hypothetical protein [Pontibacter chitinilyticus]|uniref:hypothetical protein n=1 Tax=Pontibacter chitinilyticus TaxID=2674989 RepID=UPI003218F1BD